MTLYIENAELMQSHMETLKLQIDSLSIEQNALFDRTKASADKMIDTFGANERFKGFQQGFISFKKAVTAQQEMLATRIELIDQQIKLLSEYINVKTNV